MRKLALLVFAAATVGFAGMASAGEPQGQASGHGCTPAFLFPEQKNPGHLFQALKAAGGPTQGLNPKQIAELVPEVDKVSEYIQSRCDNSPS